MTPSNKRISCSCKNRDCTVPFGLCHCGCGEETNLTILFHPGKGVIKVTPSRFSPRHQFPGRKPPIPKKRPGILVPYSLDGKPCFALPLTDGQFAVIDIEDGALIGRYRWSPFVSSGNTYAIRKDHGRVFLMHREVLGLEHGNPLVGDHIETGNTLDNRRSNLRVATRAQNSRNRTVRSESRTGVKGVRFESRTGKWTARIKHIHLGTFITKREAVEAYNRSAIEHFGDFACLIPLSPHDSAHTRG